MSEAVTDRRLARRCVGELCRPPSEPAWAGDEPHPALHPHGCPRPAVATLTYAYADLTAVVGPLAASEPHSYDLCEEHAVRLTVPRGWEVLRHVGEFPAPIPHGDDLEALAEAVREAARVEPQPGGADPDTTPAVVGTCGSSRPRPKAPGGPAARLRGGRRR